MKLALADRLALADLVHLYAAAVDDRRFGDVVELFTDTAELRIPDPPHQLGPVRVHGGKAGVRAAMAALMAVERTEHELVGEVYAAQPEPDYALGRITCVAHHWSRRNGQVTDLVWHLRYDDSTLRCVVYHGDSGMELRLESAKATILSEPFDMHPRAFARTKALRESLKRRGWREQN